MKNISSLKRALSVLMVFTILAGLLTACGGGDKNEGGEQVLSEYVYVPSYTEIPEEVTDISNPYMSGDTIFFSANMPFHADGTIATEEEINNLYSYESRVASSSDVGTAVVTETADGTISTTTEAEDVALPEEPVENDITYKTALFAMNKDGTDYHQLADYVPMTADSNDKYSYAYFNYMVADGQGNIWITETVNKTIFDLPEGFDSNTQDPWEYYVKDETNNYLRKLSDTGAELASIDLSQFAASSDDTQGRYGGSFYINNMIADEAGNVYISDGDQNVYVFGSDASFLFKLSLDSWASNFIKIKDGTVGITTNAEVTTGEGGYSTVLKIIDVATKDWGKDYTVPDNIWDTSDGGDKYDFCYTNSSALFGYNIETETSEKILTWLNCDVDGDNVSFSTIMDNDDVFAISQDYSSQSGPSYEIITMVKTPRSEVKQKTTLTLATMWLDYNLKSELLKFNKTNPDYRIEIVDYSEFNTNEDYNAGITKLNTEIISGNIPDIIDISNLPYKQYAAKGLLEDLYPYIENDSDIDRDDLMPGIMKALETDGKLYTLISSFYVMSIIGAPSVVGDDMGWTMADMQRIVEEHPEADKPFGYYMTRSSLLQNFCMLNMDKYMNWQTGECSFDSDEFKNLLKFAATFPDDADYDNDEEWIDSGTLIQDGRQIFEMFSASDFQNYQYYKAMFGGAITFKGYPSDSGTGNVAQINGGLAMTTSCENKDGAWQFMSTLLSDDFQENLSWGYPVSKKAYEKQLTEAMKQEYTTDENGNKVPVSHGGMSMGDGDVVEFYAITQDEADQLTKLIDSVDHIAVYDDSLMNIITEEAASFFSGEKTVDQVADIIQSRMTIYINEQR